jgi:hypothetical protein
VILTPPCETLRATHFDPRHAGARPLHGRRHQVDHVDRPVEDDTDAVPARPTDLARDGLALLELDADALAGFDVRVNPDHHAARRNVADEAQLAPLADPQCADAQQAEMALAAAPLCRFRRLVR